MAIAQGQFTLTEVNDGSNGAGVVKIDNYYYASSSDTSVPSTENGKWKTNISNLTDKYGKSFPYLWNYEVTTLENGSTLSTSPELISHYGTDGRGIHEVKEYYLRSSSSSGINKPTSEPTSIPDSGISNNTWYSEPVATTSTYKYLWNCEKIVYTDGTNGGYTTPAIIGTHGSTGSTGAAAVTLSLDNDFISIPCKSNGDFINSTFLSSLTVVLSVYSGATLQQIQTTSSSGTYYRSKIKVNATGITATLANAANSDGTINLTFSNMTAADKATVTISLHSSNTGHSNSNKKAEVSLEIVKNKQGKDGEYIYISTSRQSYVLEREKILITLNAYQKQGANPPIAYSGDWAVDGASIASGESNSSTCIIDTFNSTGNIVVTFSKGGVILDKETIVALSDGKPGDPGDPGTVQGTKLFYSATASDITAPYVDLTSSKTSSDVEDGQIAFNTTTWYSEAKFFGVKNTTDSTKYGAWDIRQSAVVCRPGYAPCVWKIELILSQADGKWYCAYSPQKVSLLEAATIAAQIQATGSEETDNLAFWCKEAGLSIIDGSTIATGSIDADRLSVNSLSAISANLGTVTAGVIQSQNYVAGTSGLQLDLTSGNADITGKINATSGSIGGYTISKTTLTSGGVGMNSDTTKDSLAFWAGATNKNKAPFKVVNTGDIIARQGKIANFEIATPTNLSLSNDTYVTTPTISNILNATNNQTQTFTFEIKCDGPFSKDLSVFARVYLIYATPSVMTPTSQSVTTNTFTLSQTTSSVSKSITCPLSKFIYALPANSVFDKIAISRQKMSYESIKNYNKTTIKNIEDNNLWNTYPIQTDSLGAYIKIPSGINQTTKKYGVSLNLGDVIIFYNSSYNNFCLIYIPNKPTIIRDVESMILPNDMDNYLDVISGYLRTENKESYQDKKDGIYLSAAGFGIGEYGYYFNHKGEINCGTISSSDSVNCTNLKVSGEATFNGSCKVGKYNVSAPQVTTKTDGNLTFNIITCGGMKIVCVKYGIAIESDTWITVELSDYITTIYGLTMTPITNKTSLAGYSSNIEDIYFTRVSGTTVYVGQDRSGGNQNGFYLTVFGF